MSFEWFRRFFRPSAQLPGNGGQVGRHLARGQVSSGQRGRRAERADLRVSRARGFAEDQIAPPHAEPAGLRAATHMHTQTVILILLLRLSVSYLCCNLFTLRTRMRLFISLRI